MGSFSAGIETVKLDVTLDEDVDRVIKFITQRSGRIDVLVNNAGALSIGERRII